MTNERILIVILVVFVVGAMGYFTFTRFKQDVSTLTSPSPSPKSLEFAFNKPSPTQAFQQQQSQQTSLPSSERPYFRNKYVGKFPGFLTEESLKNKKVSVYTNKGAFEIEIFEDTPVGSSNFLLLVNNGFYDGLKFHRVEQGFIVQGGDPLGDGTGGPGYTFQDEAVNREYNKGIVAYANAGPNTNGSQFFIMLEDKLELPKSYTIFGKVISGMDIVEKITPGDVMQKVIVQNLQ